MRAIIGVLMMGLLWSGTGCATQPATVDDPTCEPTVPDDCGDGLVCDQVQDGEPQCFEPVRLLGIVVDATDEAPIAGALVQAVDVNGTAVGTSAETAADGTFEIAVPVLRQSDGSPIDGTYTLRAQAAAYQQFPTAIRPALPIDVTAAEMTDAGWTVENALTTIKLLPLPGDLTALGSISGTVEGDLHAGILVVAEGVDDGYSGYSDADGVYTIFNVPAGNYTVRGYAAGVQLTPATTTLTAGEEKSGVDLTASDEALSTVSGSVQIVNAPGDARTSVILAIESTFDEAARRGEAPPGLRVGDVATDFIIEDVPNGRYVVLAAFENDDLVRDPDQSIAGTKTVHIEVPDPVMGRDIVLGEGFKVTEALGVIAPGAEGSEAIVDPVPVFEWADDSSEDGYEVRVFDAFGTELWMTEIGPVSGPPTVSVTYGGPALEVGLFYQFRALSFRERTGERTAISTTEDLKGVFQLVESLPPAEP